MKGGWNRNSLNINEFHFHKTYKLCIGSSPSPGQVSLPTGQPFAAEASAGVSETRSPVDEQPP